MIPKVDHQFETNKNGLQKAAKEAQRPSIVFFGVVAFSERLGS